MQTILLTGGDGFVGRATRAALDAAGVPVRLALRQVPPGAASGSIVEIGDIAAFSGWPATLDGITCVVHLANVAHVGAIDFARARAVNVDATARLAEAAAHAGVARFIYVSSAKVHGEETTGAPLDEHSPLVPGDPYAALKVEAERRLGEIAERSGVALVGLRPPLVYGAGVKANVLALMHALHRGWPLPLASIENRRSLVYVGNLAAAIVRCIDSSAAAGKTFLVADGPPVSTPELCRVLGAALGNPARLFPFPASLLELVPTLRKLTRSFEIDDSAIRRELGWTPPYTFKEGIRATAEWYLHEGRSSRG